MKRSIVVSVLVIVALAVTFLFLRGRPIPKNFLDLVPDAVIETAVKDYADGFYYDSPADGRFAVFEKFVCPHYLGGKDLAQKDGDGGDPCWKLLYAAYSGGEWYFDNDFPGEFSSAEQKDISETRELIMEIARTYLKDPAHLHAFYEAKKDVFVGALRSLPAEKRTELVENATRFIEGMKLSRDPTIFTLASNIFVIEQRFAVKDWKDDNLWRALEGAEVDLRDALDGSAGKNRGVRFALRRWDEGGDTLRDTWIGIGEDFLAALKQ